jgi:hypothetical protein
VFCVVCMCMDMDVCKYLYLLYIQICYIFLTLSKNLHKFMFCCAISLYDVIEVGYLVIYVYTEFTGPSNAVTLIFLYLVGIRGCI